MSTVVELFRERLMREGRLLEYEEYVRKLMAGGLTERRARWEAMRRFGYRSRRDEMMLHAAYANREAGGLERAIGLLPDRASVGEELDWIRAHPAMARGGRGREVELTEADILDAPHGRAPSKAAVFALRHWANNPNEFFKQMLLREAKRPESSHPAQGGVEVEEVERALKEFGRHGW